MKFIRNAGTLFTGVIVTLAIIVGSLSGTYNNQASFAELMKESAKLNLSVAIGLGALVFACLTVQNRTDLKVHKERYYNYLGVMFYFIILNLAVFYLAYFPKSWSYKLVLTVYYILTIGAYAGLLFATARILRIIFGKRE